VGTEHYFIRRGGFNKKILEPLTVQSLGHQQKEMVVSATWPGTIKEGFHTSSRKENLKNLNSKETTTRKDSDKRVLKEKKVVPMKRSLKRKKDGTAVPDRNQKEKLDKKIPRLRPSFKGRSLGGNGHASTSSSKKG